MDLCNIIDYYDYIFKDCENIKEIYLPNINAKINNPLRYADIITYGNTGLALESYYIGEKVRIFYELHNDPNLKKAKVYIPKSCCTIRALPECIEKIYGQTGSYAEEFANENGIEFIPVKEGYIRGDFNYDGEVNIADVTETQRYLAGLSTIDHVDEQVAYWQGNFDADNHFDVKDVTYLQKYLAEYELYLNGTEEYVNGVRQ